MVELICFFLLIKYFCLNNTKHILMIYFFGSATTVIYAVETQHNLTQFDIEKLKWLLQVNPIDSENIEGTFIGPRAVMITPWSTNAVEITQNMGIQGISRIEEFHQFTSDSIFDVMLFEKFNGLNQHIFSTKIVPQPIIFIDDIASYNAKEGLALSQEEINYLNTLSMKLKRKLTDAEVFGFSQINSEHCRHKIFNGTFVINGEEKPLSLFKLIKKTSETHPNDIISAYKDNVAFIKGPNVIQFAPEQGTTADFYKEKEFASVVSLKAETHNFPTTVEPFNGAATGSGGEIRDRLAGGLGAIPLAGTAVYMTAYSRLNNHPWHNSFPSRKWLYQTPKDILIKASNGASDFGNKFGQPLICGSLFTFEHKEDTIQLGYDKVIMLAGGVGYGKLAQSKKGNPKKGDKIVVMGGDNYRIGMGGAAVSSADTGEFQSAIELNAIQRSNPEMQKRVANAIRTLVEQDENPIISIHDHGAGGHLNCLSELVEETGGIIYLDKLPIGDPTLSAKEIMGNESQERMGLIIEEKELAKVEAIAQRERAPFYVVGEVTGDKKFVFTNSKTGEKPLDFELQDLFGNSPKTILKDDIKTTSFQEPNLDESNLASYLENVLQLESVACKDWLTNKVDRCVGGKIAKQQCAGVFQLPLNNVGVTAIDFATYNGIATAIGHSPVAALIDPAAGSKNAIGEALTNIIWAPLSKGIKSVSLSANWMWACKNPGEDARLYQAVEACSQFAIALGINIPTGKDSLSMKQKYQDSEVIAPGTVIISATATCQDIRKVVEPVFQPEGESVFYINFSQDKYCLGGSALYQTLSRVGVNAPTIKDPQFFVNAFNTIQQLILENQIVAGHDISGGGFITTLFELCFSQEKIGASINLDDFENSTLLEILFSENCGIVFQAKNDAFIEESLANAGVAYYKIGKILPENRQLIISFKGETHTFAIDEARDTWYKTSFLFDCLQTQNNKALERFENYRNQPLTYHFPSHFIGLKPIIDKENKPKAAVIREKGSNSEREMANALYLAGFDVKDVHMTDLINGRETLEDVQFIGAVGGFSNSDVLGSAKGWAGAFLFNEKAKRALDNFFERPDTLSIGICNGCQLFMELEKIHPELPIHGKMKHNDSKKHESNFTSVVIQENHSVMLQSLTGTKLGVWISHGEGKFNLELDETHYHIVAKYAYEGYPANPNGSSFATAMLCDKTGRHLVTMPHIERSIFPHNWAYYPKERNDEVSPWLEAFINAKKWIQNRR